MSSTEKRNFDSSWSVELWIYMESKKIRLTELYQENRSQQISSIVILWTNYVMYVSQDKIGRCIITTTRVILEGEITDSFPLDEAKSGKLKLNLKWNPQTIFRDAWFWYKWWIELTRLYVVCISFSSFFFFFFGWYIDCGRGITSQDLQYVLCKSSYRFPFFFPILPEFLT